LQRGDCVVMKPRDRRTPSPTGGRFDYFGLFGCLGLVFATYALFWFYGESLKGTFPSCAGFGIEALADCLKGLPGHFAGPGLWHRGGG